MSQIIADRVKETTTTTGTGAITLAGAASGFRAFSAVCSVNDTAYYVIDDGAGAWEVGLGTYSALNTLTRTTVLASSNAGAAVNFGAGSKSVWLDAPAAQILAKQDKSPTVYANGNISGATSINLANGDVQSATITGATTITVTGWPASGVLGQLTLKLTNAGSAVVSITNGKYAGGTAPTYTAAGLDVIELESSNGGTSVDVYLAGKDMK